MNSIPLGKDNYKRPKKTYQDQMTIEQIEEKLKGYVEVEDIRGVALNSHVRYFSIIKNRETGKLEKKFRLGGFLKNRNDKDNYVILSNNKNSWSVQMGNTIFYRQMKSDEIVDKYERKIKEYKKLLKEYKRENKKLKKKLGKYT